MWVLATLFTVGCASQRTKTLPESVVIEMKGKAGESWETEYVSTSRTWSYTEGQLIRDRTEEVDFTIQTQVRDYDSNSGLLRFEVKTLKKEGVIPLRDLAFPELGETIDYVVQKSGKVLKAGAFRPDSLFYVPSLPIPKGPVQVGDTWSLTHAWISGANHIPLQLEAVGILKAIEGCGKDSICARIEISGGVDVLGAMQKSPLPVLSSEIRGSVLFDVASSDVIWSQIVSEDQMAAGSERTKVLSCMVSWRKGSKRPEPCDWLKERADSLKR